MILLTSKFNEIKVSNQKIEKVEPFDSEKQLVILNDILENSHNVKKVKREKVLKYEKRFFKYVRKDKMDYNLKKIENCIPYYLIEKFHNNKK